MTSTLTPYFRSKASAAGRANWLRICVVYQTTRPSFFAASIIAASAAWASGFPMARSSATPAIRRAGNPRDISNRSVQPRLNSPRPGLNTLSSRNCFIAFSRPFSGSTNFSASLLQLR